MESNGCHKAAARNFIDISFDQMVERKRITWRVKMRIRS